MWKSASWKSPLKIIPTACVFALLVIVLVMSAKLPDVSSKQPSSVLMRTGETHLDQVIDPAVAQQSSDSSGVIPLSTGYDAFAARYLLAESAERSIDIQTYIWHDDTTGRLMFDAVHRAADRGVKVRLLIDDNNTSGMDPLLVMLDQHPNIEVRLANPFAQRDFRIIAYLTDFTRLNRRMHNKSFTVDDQAAVVGGRNIGDEYFAIAEESNFIDLDVLAIGKVVHDVSSKFDLYWNSDIAYPVSMLLTDVEPMGRGAFADQIINDPIVPEYKNKLITMTLVDRMLNKQLEWEWDSVVVLSDSPAKLLPDVQNTEPILLDQLIKLFGVTKYTLDLVSPYFVPGEKGTSAFTDLAQQGVNVRILTNSLAATDVSAVHAGYAKRRKDLLENGVQLYELKPTIDQKVKKKYNIFSTSDSSLHAKTFGIDGDRVFVGSFNFDPRSANLNSEMGFVITSRALTERLAYALDNIKNAAYEVTLNDAGQLEWHDNQDITYVTEPETSVLNRIVVKILSILPIEGLL
jgi:putative cardiolipin synthase